MSFLAGIRAKLVLLLLVFGLLPVIAVGAFFKAQRSNLEEIVTDRLEDSARSIADVIDRNLFERYGDVQAFLLNPAVADRDNWKKAGAANGLIEAMDGYTQLYGLYKVMLLVDAKGDVLAVNSVGANGKPIATEKLYGQNFADASWLKRTLAEDYLKGTNGLSGTVVDVPGPSQVVAQA